jgi:hypothetical protein
VLTAGSQDDSSDFGNFFFSFVVIFALPHPSLSLSYWKTNNEKKNI